MWILLNQQGIKLRTWPQADKVNNGRYLNHNSTDLFVCYMGSDFMISQEKLIQHKTTKLQQIVVLRNLHIKLLS